MRTLKINWRVVLIITWVMIPGLSWGASDWDTDEALPLDAKPLPQEMQDLGAPGKPVQLQVQQQGLPKALMFRQLQPQVYPRYEEKMKPLAKSLKAAYRYLRTLENQEPSLQRISAFTADAWLDWNKIAQTATPEEQQLESFKLMREVVMELRGLSDYWITSNRVQRISRGTKVEADIDRQILEAKRQKIGKLLATLEQQQKRNTQLRENFPP